MNFWKAEAGSSLCYPTLDGELIIKDPKNPLKGLPHD